MAWVNYVILGYCAIGLFSGLRRGLLQVGFSLAGYLVGILLASKYQVQATARVLKQVPIQSWVNHVLPAPVAATAAIHAPTEALVHSLVAILIFLAIVGIVEAVGRMVGTSLTQVARGFRVTGSLNQLGGAAAGMAEHVLIIGLAISVLSGVPFLSDTPLMEAVHRSMLAGTITTWYSHWVKIPSLSAL